MKDSSHDKYLSSILLVEKKDSSQRPVINLKSLNQHIAYEHFRMEEFYLLGELQGKLKDAYFVAPLHEESQSFVCFEWKDKLCQFACLCFSLAPAPLVFTKLMKIPIAVIRRLNGNIITCPGNILIMTSSREALLILRDTLIFLLQNLGFVINFKMSIFYPCHFLELLGLEIDSLNMMVELTNINLYSC